MRIRGIFIWRGTPATTLNVAPAGRYRFFLFLRDLADRNKLFARGLGAAVPRLAQKRDRGSGLLGWVETRSLPTGSSICRSPDTVEDKGAGLFSAVTLGRDGLHRFAERIHARVGMLPGVEERFRIKRADVLPHFLQFQQARTFGNEQANAKLNGSNIFDQGFGLDDSEEIEITLHRRPLRKRNERWMKNHSERAESANDVKEILPRVPFIECAEH